jgi:amino acid adenylation domain-containing protein
MATELIVPQLLTLPTAWRERTAFTSSLGQLSFGALSEGALGFAAWLARDAGVRPRDRVAICLPRNLEAAQAIIGILAAGAAYVPIQLHGPVLRLCAILEAIDPKLLVTTGEMKQRLSATGCKLPPVATVEQGGGLAPFLAPVSIGRAPVEPRPDDIAGIFLTSGSSGEPKGVMLSHRSMGEMAGWISRWNGASAADRLMSDAGLHYATAFDLFTPLFAGCRTILLSDREAMFPERVAEIMERTGTTVWCSSATALHRLFEDGDLGRRDLGALRRVEFFGEPLSVPVLRRLMECLPAAEFVNFYGATEAHRIAFYEVPRPLPGNLTSLPIGEPTDNYVLTLRDEAESEVPPGEVGEICVAGPKVLTGYANDPDLTSTKRVGGLPGTYRTGDLGWLGADGLLRLVGRKDQIVKLRGNRFDLGEIEAVLKSDPAVAEAIAFAIPDPRGNLDVRAVVRSVDGVVIENRLRRLSAERLPRFARPVRIDVLPRFPLLPSGKIDRQALRRLVTDE